MELSNLQRYKSLLLEKQRELSPVRGLVPAAGGWEGDVIDQANADAEAELQIRMQETDAQLLEAIEEALARMGMTRLQFEHMPYVPSSQSSAGSSALDPILPGVHGSPGS